LSNVTKSQSLSLLALVLVLAGCTGGGASPTASTPDSSASSAPTSTPANPTPTITGVPAVTKLSIGQAFSYTPTVTGAGQLSLAFQVANAPAWLTLNTSTGTLSGTPNAADVGTFSNIHVSITDGQTLVQGPAFSLTVEPATSSPPSQTLTISGSPVTAAVEGTAWSFRPSASDAPGKTLTFRVVNAPSFASFDSTTGTLSGTPPAHSAGSFASIVVSVSDGSSEAALPAFTLTVSADAAPTIAGTPPSGLSVGQAMSFTPSTTDGSGRALAFSVSGLPSWASFSATSGTLSGTPVAAGTSSPITITVSDGVYSASLAPFSVTVSQPAPGTVTLSWNAPTLRADGTALTNLFGYRIYYGTSSGNYTNVVMLPSTAATSYTFTNLPTGATYYFSTSAIDANYQESSVSNETSRTI
jgi:hypothetical protein